MEIFRRVPLLHLIGLVLLAVGLISCGVGGGPSTGNSDDEVANPAFVINSPIDGSLLGGPTFFSVQPLDPADVSNVHFQAGDRTLKADATGENTFRVFFLPQDFPAGEVKLTATVTTNDGRSGSRSVTVTNVPEPPSSTTVGSNGAVLGTREPNGSLSTMTIPAGQGAGAFVSFESRTQEEVKDLTGIDYGALGVTFLGAQEIGSSEELGVGQMVSSGGFAEQVQPSQVVVNYSIGPDVDGDGVGELVVVSGASVAPNGDVVSEPLPVVQVDETAVETSSLRSLSAGISGPPGTAVGMDVNGFNHASPFGNVAVFEGADGSTVQVAARVNSVEGRQRLSVNLPALPPGPAKLILHNLSTGSHSQPIDLTVHSPAIGVGDAEERIGALLDLFLEAMANLDGLPDTGEPTFLSLGHDLVDRIDTGLAQRRAEGDTQSIIDFAAFLDAGAVGDLLEEITASSLSTSSSFRTLQAGCGPSEDDVLDKADEAFNAISNGSNLLGFEGLIPGWMVGQWWTKVKEVAREIDRNLSCPPPPPAPPAGRPLGGSGGITGMGAVPPQGGSIAGAAYKSGSFGRLEPSSQQLEGYGQEPGKFVIKVYSSAWDSPFSGMTDAAGYFMIPQVPAGEPFTAVATDSETGETRSLEGMGPPKGETSFLFFDFSNGEDAITTARWDGGGDGTSWDDELNWEGDELPGPADRVVIDLPSAVTVEHRGFDTFIHSLDSQEELILSGGQLWLGSASTVRLISVEGGNLLRDSELIVAEGLTWKQGEIAGTGTVVSKGSLAIDGTGCCRTLAAGSIENAGSGVLGGDGLRVQGGAAFRNLAGATLTVDATAGMSQDGTFENAGTLVVRAGTATSRWTTNFNNLEGTVNVESGTLELAGGGTSTGGIFEVSGSSALIMGFSSTFTLTGAYSGGGAGPVQLDAAGTVVIAPDGASFDFPNGGFLWRRGTLAGTGTLRNLGLITVFDDLEGCCRDFGELSLDNQGDLVLSSNIRGGATGGTIINSTGALIDVRADVDITSASSSPVTVENSGTVTKSGGEGTASWSVCYLDEGGSIDSQIELSDVCP